MKTALAMALFASISIYVFAGIDQDPQGHTAAHALGFLPDANWTDWDASITGGSKLGAEFIIIWAEDGDSQYNRIYYKPGLKEKLRRIVDLVHPGLEISYSPNSQRVLFDSTLCAGMSTLFVLPTASLDHPITVSSFEIKKPGLKFYGLKKQEVIEFSEPLILIRPELNHCAHLEFEGIWIDNDHIHVKARGGYCGKDGSEFESWDFDMNLVKRKIELLRKIKD